MSAGSGLPDVREAHRTMDSSQQQLRKASPEALALMMANKKKNDEARQSSAHWVPGGKSLKKNDSR